MKSNIHKMFTAVATVAAISLAAPASAEVHVAPMKELAGSKVKAWLQSDAVVSAVKAQNAANAGLDEPGIIKMDKQWRAETKSGSGPLIDKVLNNALSAYLKKIKAESQGLYTEIFVMDNKGLNVGQSDVTSDYWQGDEAKWKQTFAVGPNAVHISDVEEDESTQTFQSQLSVSIIDPKTGKPIGAVTIGVDMEALGI